MIQRYRHECTTYAGKPMRPHEEGGWVDYKALAAYQSRIERLEAALRELLDACEQKEKYVPNSQRGKAAAKRWLAAWDGARAALPNDAGEGA